MSEPLNTDELRERFVRNELEGEELVQALVLVMGYDQHTAELIASGDFLPDKHGDMEKIA